jgi:predicted metalloprotease with PDZ domain
VKRTWIAFLIACAALARADISYKVIVQPEKENLHVTMHLPGTSSGSRLQIPNWAPGAYVLRDGFASVQNLKAVDASGASLNVEKVMQTLPKTYEVDGQNKVAENKVCTWVVAPARETTVEYDIALKPVDGAVHWSGPSTYLYETNRLREKCVLEIQAPSGWASYLGLDSAGRAPNVYTAKDYDTLADNPVTVGAELTVDRYMSRGKPHWIVMRGKAREKVNREALIRACKFVSDSQTDFFGSRAPYNLYVWHFNPFEGADGAGGLEHLSSTQIGMATGLGPRVVSVLAHEFFHLWNVKRIRSKPLGPFDYTKLPQTGALWWLEGVTDYYASTLLYRYGWSDLPAYLATAASNVQTVRRNPAHMEVGPFEASMRVDESSNGRGNSGGYRLSYYNLGWVAGMVLDIELRSQSKGRASLDDVTKALWDQCRDDRPGFEEGEIRKQFVRLGGDGMGEFFDQVIMHGGKMAVEETLAKVGLRLVNNPEPFTDSGFSWSTTPGAGLAITGIRGNAIGKLRQSDTLLGVNGKMLEGATSMALSGSLGAALRDVAPGKPYKLSVRREGQIVEVEITPTQGFRDVLSMARIPYATSAQRKLADAWLARRKFVP